MTNPFLSTDGPHPHPFWNEQAYACEEARAALVKHPIFAAFLAAGGKIDVVIGDSYVALLKDGDSVIRGLSFWYTPGYSEPLLIQQESQQAIAQLTAWLTEARDNVKPARPEITAGDIIAGRVFFSEDGAGFTASTVSGDVVYCPELGITLLREDFAQALNDGRAIF